MAVTCTQADRFLTRRFGQLLAELGACGCTCQVLILQLRRPQLPLQSQLKTLKAYALLRKAAQLGCSGVFVVAASP